MLHFLGVPCWVGDHDGEVVTLVWLDVSAVNFQSRLTLPLVFWLQEQRSSSIAGAKYQRLCHH